MNSKTKAAPNGSGKAYTSFSNLLCKDKVYNLSHQQRRLYNLLSDGVPRNVADISTQLRMCDPRGVIRDLRHSGVPVQSYWVTTSTSRHKMYFIK